MTRRRHRARTLALHALLSFLCCIVLRPVLAQAITPPPAGPADAGSCQTPSPRRTRMNSRHSLLLTDLQRYAAESPEELRRELAIAATGGRRVHAPSANRIRLAVLLTMPAAGAADDARALALLDSVVGKTGGASPVKQLAAILYLQIAERVRNVAEERRKSAAAQEKLDQLRAVERSLLLERSRNAGGAGGGGGGGTGR